VLGQIPDIRKYYRAPLGIRVNCLGPGTFFSDFAVNISEGGIMVQAISEVPPGTDLEIQFSLPGTNRTIKAVGEVIWSRRNPVGDGRIGVGLGVRFKRIDREELSVIRDFVEKKAS
jgi:uncharacterized protein (TIGR02266 family)